MVNESAYQQLKATCNAANATLVAVSKIQPPEAIMALYNLGHRHFGENYVQELLDKQARLPADICWHFIGHLQSNKAKMIVPFVHLIHGVDSAKLLYEINKQAKKMDHKVSCLLQMHIAQEETKYGMDEAEIQSLMNEKESLPFVQVKGLMGMASFTENTAQVAEEFSRLKKTYDAFFSAGDSILSMGMSGDYELALQHGSNMLRVGSLLFGARK